jgi:hypothetical protein
MSRTYKALHEGKLIGKRTTESRFYERAAIFVHTGTNVPTGDVFCWVGPGKRPTSVTDRVRAHFRAEGLEIIVVPAVLVDNDGKQIQEPFP